MTTLLRFELPNELNHIRSCIMHTSKRAVQRLGVEFDEYAQCEIISKIQSGELEVFGRETTRHVWIRTKLEGKICFLLYNEALETIQTIYSKKMIEKKRPYLRAA